MNFRKNKLQKCVKYIDLKLQKCVKLPRGHIMKRIYEEQLLEWLHDDKRKPLMVLGARQVGKTHLIRHLFAEKYFAGNHLYIDLSNDEEIRRIISEASSDTFLEYISRRWKKELGENTLLIFDEVQTCLPLVSLLKPICENRPDIPIIVTGSLVTLCLNREKDKRGKKKESRERLYPVGKINTLHVSSLNYEEYLLNANPLLLEDIRKCYKEKEAVPLHIHTLAQKALFDYLSIGGMPEALDYYLKTGKYRKSRKILDDIYDTYIGDMSFNQSGEKDLLRTVAIYENIITMLGKESKDFHPSLIEKGKRTRDFLSPLEWLILSETVLSCHKTKDRVVTPLKKEEGSSFRLYFSDVGMFLHAGDISGEEFLLSDSNSLSGAFFENYVATELKHAGLPLFYWKGKNDAKFEFLLQENGKAIPIEVKKGNGSPRSLLAYDSHNKRDLCIKLSSGNLGYDKKKKLLSLPLYMACFLFKDIKAKTLEISKEWGNP